MIKPSSEGFSLSIIMEVIINTTSKQNSLIYRSWGLILIMSFLFSLYYLVLEKFYILAILILISLPSTLIIATTQSHTVYLKGVIFNICISFLICLYPLYLFDKMITYGFLIYCLIDYFILKKKWNRTLEQYLTTDDSTPLITNRDQFVLDYEVQHGRIWQLKYHIPLMYLILIVTIPLVFLGRLSNGFFLFAPVGLFFAFLLWEYTLKRFLFFHDFFKVYKIKKAH